MKELRRAPRIATSIETDFWKTSSLELAGTLTRAKIINLSFGGCCLLTAQSNLFDVHDKIHLAFRLDNELHTKIERDATICRVTVNQIGCKFTPNVHGHEPEFVSYINERVAPK